LPIDQRVPEAAELKIDQANSIVGDEAITWRNIAVRVDKIGSRTRNRLGNRLDVTQAGIMDWNAKLAALSNELQRVATQSQRRNSSERRCDSSRRLTFGAWFLLSCRKLDDDRRLIAGAGNDTLLGGQGNDGLVGELGADRLVGEAMNNCLAPW